MRTLQHATKDVPISISQAVSFFSFGECNWYAPFPMAPPGIHVGHRGLHGCLIVPPHGAHNAFMEGPWSPRAPMEPMRDPWGAKGQTSPRPPPSPEDSVETAPSKKYSSHLLHYLSHAAPYLDLAHKFRNGTICLQKTALTTRPGKTARRPESEPFFTRIQIRKQ